MFTGRTARLAAALTCGALLLSACTSSSDGGKKSTSPSAPSSETSISATPTRTTTTGSSALISATKLTGSTSIAFTSAFVKALYTKGVNTTPTGHAGLDDTHRAQLPISGGSATLWGAGGSLSRNIASLKHSGSGLRVSTKKTRVTVSDIVLTLGAHPAISAVLGATSTTKPASPSTVRLFDLKLTSPAKRTSDGITLTGITATLDSQAVRELDAAFDTTLFANYGSKKVGTVSITVTSN